MSKPAALYIRVSTDDQLEFSPGAQKRALLKYANDNDYLVHKSNIFIDEGISGRQAEKRPAFMKMIARAKEKVNTSVKTKDKNRPFNYILVHKFDRFARSREDSVVYKSLLKKECGVKVISITESVEDDKFAIILEAMLEAMAEYYSINLSEEVKKGMTEKALRGGLQTSPPFGYAALNNKLEPIAEEAILIKEIFRRFICGEGFFAIAKWLNSLGVKTHRGNKFENRTVEYIIRNPVYIGKLRWNPKERTRRDYDNKNIIVADAEHKPLIDNNTWEAAQRRVRELKSQWKYHGRPATEHKDWLSGIVQCSECGCSLVFSKPHYWKCNGYTKGACKFSQHVRDDLIKEAIISQLCEDIKSTSEISYKKLSVSGSGTDTIDTLSQHAAKAEKKLERLRNAYLDGIETVTAYKRIKSTIENELAGIKSQIEQAANAAQDIHADVEIKSIITSIREILISGTAENFQKNNAIKSIVDTCTFNKAENLLVIEYRYIVTAEARLKM